MQYLCVNAFCSVALKGCSAIDEWPTIELFNVSLKVDRRFYVDVRPILPHFTTLPQEWADMRGRARTCGLGVYEDDGKVPLGCLLAFLEARIFYSGGQLAAEHWLTISEWCRSSHCVFVRRGSFRASMPRRS